MEGRTFDRVMGLDRVAEVKTLRRKWHRLCKAGKALELMEDLGRSRLEELDQPAAVIMVDGHIGIYTGKTKSVKCSVRVRLDPQSSPSRTRSVDALCRKLNEYQARFPGCEPENQILATAIVQAGSV